MQGLEFAVVLYCSLHGYYPPHEVHKYISLGACTDGGVHDPEANKPNMKCKCEYERILDKEKEK